MQHETPADRPISVSSVLTRTFHKILGTRLSRLVNLDERQKAFLPLDGCAENIFKLDLFLRYHRRKFKPLHLASVDVAKAFDSVSHNTLRDTLISMGVPEPMLEYIMYTYENSVTRLTCGGWLSESIHPTCGVKQGDPLSPVMFSRVIDLLLRRLPGEVGVEIAGLNTNAFAFADDLVFVAATAQGLQLTLDVAADYLAQCGLVINTSKSFTIALRNIPHVKKSVVDSKITFTCFGRRLPA